MARRPQRRALDPAPPALPPAAPALLPAAPPPPALLPGPAPGAGGAVLLAEVLLLLLRGVCPASPPAACPSAPCFCFSTPDTDQCRYLALQAAPQGLPEQVRNLSILGGNLTLLPGAAFAGGWRGEDDGEWEGDEDVASHCAPRRPLPHLRVLLLTHNKVEVVEGGAFAGLPALSVLDLSHNPLQALSASAFAFCPHLRHLRLNQALLSSPDTLLQEGSLTNLSLTRLELRGNRLRDAPPGWALPSTLRDLDLRNNSLRGLKVQRLDSFLPLPVLRLQLTANPLDCQCASLRPLLRWQSNATWRLPDARNLRCNSPARLKDALLRRLRPVQLGCPPSEEDEEEEARGWGLLDTSREAPDPQLETASYVFFGIVLALIGLVFLMVLYLNRRGIKRWLNNLREACRDQMEGYHYRYEQDSDPRRVGSGDL